MSSVSPPKTKKRPEKGVGKGKRKQKGSEMNESVSRTQR